MSVDLRLQEGSFAGTGDDVGLRLGAGAEAGPGDATGAIAIAFDPMLASFRGITGEIAKGTFSVAIDDVPVMDLAGAFDLAVYRGPGLSMGSSYQNAQTQPSRVAAVWNAARRSPVDVRPAWSAAATAQASTSTGWRDADRLRAGIDVPWQDGVRVTSIAGGGWQEGVQAALWRHTRFQEAASAIQFMSSRYQETVRTRRQQTARHQEASPLSRVVAGAAQDGRGLVRSWVLPWQAATPPHPGKSAHVAPPPPPPDRCYTPPGGNDVPLVLSVPWDGSTELTFVCDNHPTNPATVVVPIREVYMGTNEVSLVLASDGTPIPARQFTLSLDYQSWAWSFTARVPKAALALLDFDAGASKTLTATVNGTAFTVVAESADADRSFNSVDVTVRGRGLIAGLCADFAPVVTFANTEPRTAQQLANDALTINGVSLGWTVDWQLTDWLVPAGAWSLQGAYLDALIAIAGAAGGYVQPTSTGQTVRILPKFPSAPWNWSSVVPDFEIPSAVATREGLSWINKPVYNRVFVSGANANGVLGQVTRAGTAGDLVAPMVTDQLITHADAARQRGIAELAPGGRSVLVSLRMPVLPETGIIVPGKFVRYTDVDQQRLGIVRSVAVDVAFPAVYQTVGVETYV